MHLQDRKRSGFSLVEVNLAIFVVGLGMLTLFSLFPAGLRQVEQAHANTQEALFADYVFSTLRAEAAMLPVDEWLPESLEGVLRNELTTVGFSGSTVIYRADFPAGATPRQYMRYILEIGSSDRGRLLTARLWCHRGKFGTTIVGGDTNTDQLGFKDQAAMFYTEFAFSGMR